MVVGCWKRRINPAAIQAGGFRPAEWRFGFMPGERKGVVLCFRTMDQVMKAYEQCGKLADDGVKIRYALLRGHENIGGVAGQDRPAKTVWRNWYSAANSFDDVGREVRAYAWAALKKEFKIPEGKEYLEARYIEEVVEVVPTRPFPEEHLPTEVKKFTVYVFFTQVKFALAVMQRCSGFKGIPQKLVFPKEVMIEGFNSKTLYCHKCRKTGHKATMGCGHLWFG